MGRCLTEAARLAMIGIDVLCEVLCANCHAKRHYEQSKRAVESLGVSGQLAEFKALIAPTEEEEAAYAVVFGDSGDVDEEYRAYQEYYGVDPKNRG